MKKALTILIFLSLLTQCIAHLAVVGYFKMNQSYIAANLCENRNKPQMKCCGKCYLRKQLKKVDDNENTGKNAPTKIEKTEAIAFILPASFSVPQAAYFPLVVVHTPVLQQLRNSTLPFYIFHPPSAC